MKVNKKKFNELVKKVVNNEIGDFPEHVVENLDFQYIDIKKNRNSDDYDIIVSVNEIETSLISIRDVIEFVSNEMNIKVRRIVVEI